MPYRSTLNAYVYDGSFDGMLCCVFTAIAEKELPADIFPEDAAQILVTVGDLVSWIENQV